MSSLSCSESFSLLEKRVKERDFSLAIIKIKVYKQDFNVRVVVTFAIGCLVYVKTIITARVANMCLNMLKQV